MRSLHLLFIVPTVICLIAVASPSHPATVSERWSGPQVKAAHSAALRIEQAGSTTRLIFDLSALPKETKAYGAWLYLHKDGDQPREPILVYVAEAADAATVRHDNKRLALEPPWYRRFSAVDAVRRWLGDPRTNLGFAVAKFDGFRPEKSCLEVLYEGRPKDLPPQAGGLRAMHHDGQTFLAWTEHPAYRPTPEEVVWVQKFAEQGDVVADGPGEGAYGMPNHPAITLRALRRLQGLGLRDKPSGFQGIKELQPAAEVLPVGYRVYRHTERITAANIHQAQCLATVEPLSGYDAEVYRIHFKGEYLDQWEEPNSPMPTYCVDKGKALRPGEALYVHTPKQAGRAFYAVTMVVAGTENLAEITPSNGLAEPVVEAAGTPQPVLQWVQEDQYNRDPTEYWYRYWAAPPHVNLPSRSFRVGLAVSDKFRGPGPLAIDSISGAFNVREEIHVPRPDRVTLAVESPLPWLPELFYNEGRGTLRGMSECKVDYFAERYMEFLIKWVMGKYAIDRSKVEGSLMYFGLRHPEIFPRMSFGSYTATYDYRWAPGEPDHLGPKGIKTVDGDDAWDMYSVGGYVLKYTGRDIPFLICMSGTGKDRGHTSEFGWQDDPRGWAALENARQPFVAAWGGEGDYRFSEMFSRLRWDVSVPAFSHCSLDNNPGNGDPADGDYYGQINGYLLWGDGNQVDDRGRWEMTVLVTPNCPRDDCTVDVTPRHCKLFKPRPGEKFQWSNTSLSEGKLLQSGAVEADTWGLVTLRKVAVSKGKNRVRIWK